MRGIFIEDLKKMVLKHFEPYQTRIYLFGSFSRNQAKTSSDVDVAILPLEEIPIPVKGRALYGKRRPAAILFGPGSGVRGLRPR